MTLIVSNTDNKKTVYSTYKGTYIDNRNVLRNYDPTTNGLIKQKEKTTALGKAKTVADTFLPTCIRYINYTTSTVLLELPPGYRRISYSGATRSGSRDTNSTEFNIAVPWQLYEIFFDDKFSLFRLNVYWANKPLGQKGHVLYQPTLTNIYSNHNVCIPGMGSAYYSREKNIWNLCVSTLDMFWGSRFNNDLNYFYNPSVVRSLHNQNKAFYKKYDVEYTKYPSFYSMLSHFSLEHVVEYKFRTSNIDLIPVLEYLNTSKFAQDINYLVNSRTV